MATVSFWVEKIIEQKPFLQDCLKQGIINNAALAESITTEIEQKLKKKVKFSAVNMAVRRLEEKLSKTKSFSSVKFDKNAEISLKSNLMVITFTKEKKVMDKIKEMYNLIKFDQGDFITITQGVYEIMIVITEEYEKKIVNLLPNYQIKNKLKGLCSLSIKLPKNAINIPGFMYTISKELAWNNISVIDFVSTFTELTILVKKEDATNAFDIIKNILSSNS